MCCGNQLRDALSSMAHGQGSPIYPTSPRARAGVDRWLDWTLSTLQPVDRPVFWALVRTPPEKRDMVAIQKDVDAEAVVWRIVEAQLATRRFIEGDQFTIADIALGAYAPLAGGRRRHQAKPAQPRTLVCAVRGPPRLRPVHSTADDLIAFRAKKLQREPPETPAPMLIAPPIFMQVLVPSILTKPAPYSAHELADLAPFSGSTLPEGAALSGF